jgi:CHASE2 domain-containing sensor protein
LKCNRDNEVNVSTVLLTLGALLACILLVVVGLVVKGLLWLTVLAAGAFIVVTIAGAVRHHDETRKP